MTAVSASLDTALCVCEFVLLAVILWAAGGANLRTGPRQ